MSAAEPPSLIEVIDSHTEGEPTRVVISGGPDLGSGTVAERAARFRAQFDWFRAAVVNEPRGSEALVGALLVPAVSERAVAGAVFFNNVGLLGGCGHATIGLARTLVHVGRIAGGGGSEYVVETPVGDVAFRIGTDGYIAIDNVASSRHAKGVPVSFDWNGAERTVTGDVAWGGNWFYLVDAASLPDGLDLKLADLDILTAFTKAIRAALDRAGITGAGGAPIDHVELFGPSPTPGCDARNFVLCPGGAYDRSPCGTGTSAKLACLAADGLLAPDQMWVQESIIGSTFQASYRPGEKPGAIVPTIRGRAWITAHATLHIDPTDPFRHGIRT